MSATANNAISAIDRYQAAFDARFAGDDALMRVRRDALARFKALGVPTPRREQWKYTNLRRFEGRNFALASSPGLLEAGSADWIDRGGARFVFVDGGYASALSSVGAHPPGVTVAPLGAWAERDPAGAASRVAVGGIDSLGPFEALNLAFFTDGLAIELGEEARTEAPIYVIHHWSRDARGLMSHPRIHVRAGRHSRCVIIEQHLGPAEADCFTNAVTHFDLADGARVEHYRLQQESTRTFHIGSTTAHVSSQACYALHDISLGASLGRIDVNVLLEGPGAHAELHGLFAPADGQHLDAHTCIDHMAPCTTSAEDYRGVADGRGRGVFNGKVIVRPDAQKVDARQSSRNLLLSTSAEIDTKPELEIYANDVKCSHGATTGRLDASALFYLRSRGLSESEARTLLIRAFAESILGSVAHPPLKTYLEQRLDARFALPGRTQPDTTRS